MNNADAPASAENLSPDECLFAIISQTTVGMVQTDLTGKILLVNDRFCEIVGYQCDELLTMRLHDLTHEEDLSSGAKLFEQTGAEGKPFVIEKRYVRKDGSSIWVHCTVSAILGADGKPQSILAVALDITGRRNTEEELRQSERRLEQQSRIFDTTLSSITDFAYIFDKEGRFAYSNQPLLDLLGVTLEEITGKNFYDLNYPNDLAARLQRQIQHVFDTKEIVRDETPFTSPTGADGFYEYIFNPVFASDGTVEIVAGSTRDISERKAAEESIRFQSHLLDTVEQSVIATDLNGTITYWNRFAEELYGWTTTEAVGRNVMELTTPDVMTGQADEIMSQLRQGKSWSGEFMVQRRDGTTFPAQVANSPINDGNGKLIGVVGVSFDISTRRQAEEAVRESEEKYRNLFNSIDEGFCIIEMLFDDGGKPRDYRFIESNPMFEKLTGLKNATGKTALELVPNLEKFWIETYGKVALTGESVRFENHSEPMNRWFDVHASRVGGAESRQVAVVFNNITERKRTEDDLRYQKTLLEALTESVLDGILIVSPEGKMLHFNQHFQNIWNFPPKVIESQSDELALSWAAEQTMEPAAFLARVKTVYEQPDTEVREELLMKDGRVYERFGAPIRNGNAHYGWLWTFRDITTRKHAEDALREINQRFSATYELAPVGIVESSPECKYINGNEQFSVITGYDKKELSELSIQEITHAEDFPTDFELHQKLVGGEIPFYQIEKRYVRKDGSIVWCDLFRSAVRDAQGKTLYTIGAVSDITTRKQAEEALRESEESYRILAETASDAIIRIDENSTIQFVNTATERIFGYSPQEMVGQSLTMLMPEEMRQEHRGGFDRYLRTGKRNLNWESIEVPARHKDGHHFPLEISFGEYHRNGMRFFIGIARDITERRQAEALLRESEERFAKAFNSSPLAITITSLKTGKLIEVNDTFVNLTGFSREEAVGRTTAELGLWYKPIDRDDELGVVKSEGSIRDAEYRFRMKDETEIVGLLSAELLEIGGEPCALTVIQDITTRKRAEELIYESEEKFRNLANSISQFAWMTDASGYIFWYNERWFEYTGTTLEEMQGWGWKAVHHPEEVERVTEKFKQHIASGEIWEDTFPLRSKTGEYRWFLSRALPIRDETGKIVRWFGTNTDIEDVRLAEEKLKEADRRKDEFLATLAHELRNPLAPIRSGLEIIRRSDYNKTTIKETLETVERQTNQIIHLVDDLLEISRITQGKIKLKKERIELKTAVEMAVETNRDLIALNEHDLTVSLPDEPVFINADLTRISQIILNLLNNSAKYTEPGGKIWLTAETTADEVEIRIRDTGIGIPSEMLSDIFEMFRQIETAGEQARIGLGIGLSVVKGLVEMHGGTVTAFSAGKGKGSEFVVRLPLSKDEGERISDENERRNDDINLSDSSLIPPPPSLKILVVDDNADALEMMKVLLTLDNHTVRTAFDGETAVKIAPEFQPEVCILDIGLPRMDGYELARQLRTQMPQVFLIALSGWGQDEDRRRSSEAGFNHHLVKPIEIEELERLLAEIK